MTGFYRSCNRNTPGAEWSEGVGWHIHDEQARIEGQAKARQIKLQFLQVDVAETRRAFERALSSLAVAAKR